VGCLVREGGRLGSVQQLVESGVDGVKCTREFVKSTHDFRKFIRDLILEDFKFVIDLSTVKRHFLYFLLILFEFGPHVLVVSGGIWEVGVLGMGSGSTETRMISDTHHYDQGDNGKSIR